MKNSKVSAKAQKANKANEAKKQITVEILTAEFEKEKDLKKLGQALESLTGEAVKYIPSHTDDDGKTHKSGARTRLIFSLNGETITADKYKISDITGVELERKHYEKTGKNSGLSLVEKLEKELAEKEERVKEIKEKLLPAAREEAAKKKEEATKAADEKAEVNIEKTISSYQVKTGCSAVEAEENLLNKLLARQAARKAEANA